MTYIAQCSREDVRGKVWTHLRRSEMNLSRFWNEIWNESTKAEDTTYTMTDKQFSSNNFYEILGVESNSDQNEIKRMYQVLVLKVMRQSIYTVKQPPLGTVKHSPTH